MKKNFVQYLICISILFCASVASAQIVGIKIAGDTCTDISLSFQAEGTSSSPYFFWNFGDPASGTNDTATFTGLSSPTFPTHTFSAPGIYTVCVSFQEPGLPVSTVCRTISVKFCCQGSIKSDDTCFENNIPFNVVTTASVSAINWNFGDPTSGASNTSVSLTPTHKFSSTGSYTITANVTATCGTFTSTFVQKIGRCSTSAPVCTGLILSGDTCYGKNVNFDIQSINAVVSVNWDFGDVASGASNTAIGKSSTHVFSAIGNYTVRAIVVFECGIDTLYRVVRSVNCNPAIIINPPNDSNCKLVFPNAFSPNNDGLNDRFGSLANCSFDTYQLIIVNRWGQIVFEATDQNIKWNGLIKGQEAELGVYYYTVKYAFPNQPEKRQSGDVILIR